MNTASMPGRQRGLSLIAVLLFGVLVVMLVTVAIRILPSFLEYRAVQKAVDAAASGGNSAAEVQRAFDRQAAIDDIVSVKATDLVIERFGSGLSVSVRYEKRVPLFGPVSLLIEYAADSSR